MPQDNILEGIASAADTLIQQGLPPASVQEEAPQPVAGPENEIGLGQHLPRLSGQECGVAGSQPNNSDRHRVFAPPLSGQEPGLLM